MTRNRLILFDVDGTLIDSAGHIKLAMDIAFHNLGITPPSDQDVRGIIGLSLPEAMAALGHGDTAIALTEAYKSAFADARVTAQEQHLSPLFSGARAVLDRLATIEHYLLGVATGKSARGLRHVFSAHDLSVFFQTTQVADHHPSKPHPAMILTAIDEMGVTPQDTVLIGDTSFDMDMARNAGVLGIGVGWGYHAVEKLTDAGAKFVLNDFSELDQILANHWGQT